MKPDEIPYDIGYIKQDRRTYVDINDLIVSLIGLKETMPTITRSHVDTVVRAIMEIRTHIIKNKK